jgi:hypothetical protein
MHASTPIRIVAMFSLAFTAMLPAQSRQAPNAKPTAAVPSASLPPTPPTTIPILPPTPEQLPAHPASVTYANGLLTVSANNSSLNQILRDISRETKTKITGGVVDERVFGEYGPASTEQILNTLLDGTGSNMLFVQSSGTAPAELILSSRSGAPTPPNPNAAAEAEREQHVQEEISKQSISPEQNPERYPAPERPNVPAGEGSPSSDSADQQQAPSGPKTPQQIFDQLQKLRQQQQQPNQQ